MRRLGLILLALGLAGAGRAGRLPEVPPGGFDPRNLEHVQALAERLAAHTVRLEGTHRLPAPFDPDHPVVRDGAGVCVAPGRLVTTAGWLDGLEGLRLVRRDGHAAPVRVVRRDAERDLALLAYAPEDAPLVAVPGFVAPPAEAAAATDPSRLAGTVLVMPTTLTGEAQGVREALAGRTDGVLMLSGAASHGVPAFDRHGRVAALARRPAGDLLRSTAVSGAEVARFLDEPPVTEGAP